MQLRGSWVQSGKCFLAWIIKVRGSNTSAHHSACPADLFVPRRGLFAKLRFGRANGKSARPSPDFGSPVQTSTGRRLSDPRKHQSLPAEGAPKSQRNQRFSEDRQHPYFTTGRTPPAAPFRVQKQVHFSTRYGPVRPFPGRQPDGPAHRRDNVLGGSGSSILLRARASCQTTESPATATDAASRSPRRRPCASPRSARSPEF